MPNFLESGLYNFTPLQIENQTCVSLMLNKLLNVFQKIITMFKNYSC